ncbi:hypothetical protein MNBD_GAMMA11-2343 [hydrothermal vent metagenome]|uniref:Lysozyme n=1 Tax=hydrothermal vent metagenome TaxID=652676 RepID=A0A3B0XAX0_9ZZZZ
MIRKLRLNILVIFCLLTSCGYNTELNRTAVGNGNKTLTEEKSDDEASLFRQERTHYGLDISHYQGNLIRELGSSNKLTFIICKATQGLDYIDPDFHKNWKNIKEKGFIRGAYHFYMAIDDPVVQAEHFAELINDIDDNDISPIVDIEQSSLSKNTDKTKIQLDLLMFLDALESKFSRKPLIYTNYTFAQEYLNNPELSEYKLWLAEYSGRGEPLIPEIWEKTGYKIWQKSNSHTIDSIETDFDVYIGSKQGLVD